MAVFFFYGADTYSLREKLDFWRREFEKKYGGDMNTAILDGKTTSAQSIFQMCCSMPFLADKRFTVVRNFLSEAPDDERHALADLLEQIPESCILVIAETGEFDKRISLFKKLQKLATVTEFPAIMGTKLLGWIEKMVTKKGGTIEKEALLILSEVCGGDLYRLENEISKLVAYTSASPEASARPITRKDIELLVESQLTASIFRLTDGIGQKNKKVVVETLHQLIDSGEELFGILHMIMRQFRIITSVKDLADQGMRRDQIVSELKEHPFVVSNTMSQVKNFSMAQIKHAYALLIDMDTKIKSGGIKILAGDTREFVLALDRLVLDLCK